ncbi:hypothetical protein EMCRGX_G007103 [Ephydatia muelleri]
MEPWAGYPASVSRALDIIQSEGPSLGFHVSMKKCELFSPSVLSLFPTSIPSSNIPNFKLLGVPIGDTAFCSSFTARKCSSPLAQLSHLEDIGSSDPHVALTLLRHCASFCKLIHLARGTPSSSMIEALKAYDLVVAICFTKCTGLDISHNHFIQQLCSLPEAVSVQTLLSNPPTQQYLSDVIEESQFTILYNSMSCANKARLLSVSSPHASAWLSVVPSEVMGLHLNPCSDKALTRPADILVSNPNGSASAAYDITVTSPLNPSIILEAGVSASTAAKAAEVRKHSKYDVKCSELEWRCTPLAVETYGAWGTEARDTFSFIASRIAIITNKSKSMILSTLYSKLGIILVRSNARAILMRSPVPATGDNIQF